MFVRPRVALVAVIASLAPAVASANGAFPDSMAIFLPKDAPRRVILATNFGLLLTDDDGATWDWVCEQAVAYYVPLYQLAASNDLVAITSDGLAVSRDGACTWAFATGLPDDFLVFDAFPSPAEPARVWTIARATTSTGTDTLHSSDDGGRTIGAAIWRAPRGRTIESVEVAASDANVVYVTTTSTRTPRRSMLHRSHDGGHTFVDLALDDAAGPRVALIAAVDPLDASIVYLRVRRAPGETGDLLVIVEGDDVRAALALDTQMSGFLRRSDGALFVLTLDRSFVSTDGGHTFAPFAPGLHLRALAERGERLYAVGDNFRDGFAIGVSTDGGATWRPLFAFDQIRGPLACPHVEDVCEAPWRDLRVLFGIDDDPKPPPPAELPDACSCLATRVTPSPWLLGLALVAVRARARRGRR